MIYREHADGSRFVYILGEAEAQGGSPRVWMQEIDSQGMFVGTAKQLRGNRLGIAKEMSYATGIIPPGMEYINKLLIEPKCVVTIHDDIVTMRRRERDESNN